MINISDILFQLSQYPAYPLTPNIQDNIENLKEICDRDFTNQIAYGNSFLNQKMLLNPNIAKLLTPEVLLYLFTNNSSSKIHIYRNLEGSIRLSDAIFYGFKEKFDRFSSDEIASKDTRNIMQIIDNIIQAAELIKMKKQGIVSTN